MCWGMHKGTKNKLPFFLNLLLGDIYNKSVPSRTFLDNLKFSVIKLLYTKAVEITFLITEL